MIIVCEILIIIWKKNDNNKKAKRVNGYVWGLLTIIIPSNAYLIIFLLSGIILVLLAYIIYLFLTAKKPDKKEKLPKDFEKQQEDTPLEETPSQETETTQETTKVPEEQVGKDAVVQSDAAQLEEADKTDEQSTVLAVSGMDAGIVSAKDD